MRFFCPLLSSRKMVHRIESQIHTLKVASTLLATLVVIVALVFGLLFGLLPAANGGSGNTGLSVQIMTAVNENAILTKPALNNVPIGGFTVTGGWPFLVTNATGFLSITLPGYYTGVISINVTGAIGNAGGQICFYEMLIPGNYIGNAIIGFNSLYSNQGNNNPTYTFVSTPFLFYYNVSDASIAFDSLLTCELFDSNDNVGTISITIIITRNVGISII